MYLCETIMWIIRRIFTPNKKYCYITSNDTQMSINHVMNGLYSNGTKHNEINNNYCNFKITVIYHNLPSHTLGTRKNAAFKIEVPKDFHPKIVPSSSSEQDVYSPNR